MLWRLRKPTALKVKPPVEIQPPRHLDDGSWICQNCLFTLTPDTKQCPNCSVVFGPLPAEVEELYVKTEEPPPPDPELVFCSVFGMVCTKHDSEVPCTHDRILEEGQVELISPERARELIRDGTDVMRRAFRRFGVKFCSTCGLPIIAGECLGGCDS